VGAKNKEITSTLKRRVVFYPVFPKGGFIQVYLEFLLVAFGILFKGGFSGGEIKNI